jgi:pyridoxal phosphate enzyme (YggS family)
VDRRIEIEEALARTRERIDRARAESGRSAPVRLVVVTKTFPASDVVLLASLGVTDVGENRDQEARAKCEEAARQGARPTWHMIGQLQRNKARSVARWADVVESVDRAELVAALGQGAQAADRDLQVLIQVALDPEPVRGRGGAHPHDVLPLADQIAAQPRLKLRGVMGVAPLAPEDPSAARAAFERLAGVSERLRAQHPAAQEVSAGMSGDLEEAIAAGATQVRVGGAVLGGRPPVE